MFQLSLKVCFARQLALNRLWNFMNEWTYYEYEKKAKIFSWDRFLPVGRSAYPTLKCTQSCTFWCVNLLLRALFKMIRKWHVALKNANMSPHMQENNQDTRLEFSFPLPRVWNDLVHLHLLISALRVTPHWLSTRCCPWSIVFHTCHTGISVLPVWCAAVSALVTVLMMWRSWNRTIPPDALKSEAGWLSLSTPLIVILGSLGWSTITTASISGMVIHVSSPKHLDAERQKSERDCANPSWN